MAKAIIHTIYLALFPLALLFGVNTTAYTKDGKQKRLPKVSGTIATVIEELATSGEPRSSTSSLRLKSMSNSVVRVSDDGYIHAYIQATTLSEEALKTLKGLGVRFELVNDELGLVQGWIPLYRVEEVAGLDFIRSIKPPSYAYPRAGSLTTLGDELIGSNAARDTYRVDGSGVKIGVISDGVDNAIFSQLTGDLPPSIEIDPSFPGGGDEGTALLEIVHDIAPGASLAFSGPSTSLEFIESINFLVRTARVDIIVDDLGFLLEPFLEDGVVARAAQQAVKSGVIFISAAGNDALRHYQSLYVDTDPSSEGTNWHDFGVAAGSISDTSWALSVPPLGDVAIVLQWSDPFGASSNDYDLYLASESPSLICFPSTCRSDDIQDGDDDPIEMLVISNLDSSNHQAFSLAINRFKGQAKTLEVYFNGSPMVLEQNYNVPEDSIYGHPAAPGVISVGAVPAASPSTIESFSSRGPVSIFGANPLQQVSQGFLLTTRDEPSVVRSPVPTVVAPDRVSVTGAGSFPELFIGTSAAAPHAAGVAALILEANPSLIPAQVEEILKVTATDLRPLGDDNIYGAGLINAFSAVEKALIDAPPPAESEASSGCSIASSSTAAPIPGGLEAIAVTLLLLAKRTRGLFHRHR
ncbi:MAG: S8 family serine peptidase [Candidatus Caldarchaeum sp.]